MMGSWRCRRFRKLVDEDVRFLSERESAFVAKHRAECAACRLAETQGALALSMLRMSAMEVEVAPSFEERVLRRYKVQRAHESLKFWSPALIGAAVAGVAVLAGLQIVLNSSNLPSLRPLSGEAHRLKDRTPVFPDLSRDVSRPPAR